MPASPGGLYVPAPTTVTRDVFLPDVGADVRLANLSAQEDATKQAQQQALDIERSNSLAVDYALQHNLVLGIVGANSGIDTQGNKIDTSGKYVSSAGEAAPPLAAVSGGLGAPVGRVETLGQQAYSGIGQYQGMIIAPTGLMDIVSPASTKAGQATQNLLAGIYNKQIQAEKNTQTMPFYDSTKYESIGTTNPVTGAITYTPTIIATPKTLAEINAGLPDTQKYPTEGLVTVLPTPTGKLSSSGDLSSAAEIATYYAKQGQTNIDQATAQIAAKELGITLTPEKLSQFPTGISTEPVHPLSDSLTLNPKPFVPAVYEANPANTYELLGPGGMDIQQGKYGVDPLTGELAIFTQDYHGHWGLAGGAGRYGAQSGEFILKVPDKNMAMNLDLISPFWTENVPKAEAPGASIPWSINRKYPGLFSMNELGIGNEISFDTGTVKTSPINFGSLTTPKITGSSPSIAATGTLVGTGKQLGDTGLYFTPLPGAAPMNVGASGLSMVPGSFSMETKTTPSQPSIENFLSNFIGESVNHLSFGLVTLPTKAGFGETTTTTKYQVQIPSAFVANAPEEYTPGFKTNVPAGYNPESNIYNISTKQTTKEPSIYQNVNAELSGMMPSMDMGAKPSQTSDKSFMGNLYNQGSALTFGGYNTLQQRPLDAIMNIAVGGIYMGGGMAIGGVATTLAAGSRIAPALPVIGEGIQYALGGFYAGSVIGRSTEGLSDFSPKASERLGGILSTETAPLLIGGYAGANAGRIPTGFNDLRQGVSDNAFSLRQRMSGIENIGAGSGLNYDFTVTGRPVVRAPYDTEFTVNSMYGNNPLDNLFGNKRAGTPQETIQTFDLRPTYDLRETFDLTTITRPYNVATPAEQAMVMAQYQLSPQEIKLAKMQGLSLNDILGLRELEIPIVTTKPANPLQDLFNEAYQANMMKLYAAPMTLEAPQMSIQSQRILAVNRMQDTKTISLFGSKQIIGNNVISKLYPATAAASTTDLSSRMFADTMINYDQDTRLITGSITGRGTVQTPQQKQDILSLSDTLLIPTQTTTTKPETTTTTTPWLIKIPQGTWSPEPTTKPKPIFPDIPVIPIPGLPNLPSSTGSSPFHQTSTRTYTELLGWTKAKKFKEIRMPSTKEPARTPAPIDKAGVKFFRAGGKGTIAAITSSQPPSIIYGKIPQSKTMSRVPTRAPTPQRSAPAPKGGQPQRRKKKGNPWENF